jgi:hypothetical protein
MWLLEIILYIEKFSKDELSFRHWSVWSWLSARLERMYVVKYVIWGHAVA